MVDTSTVILLGESPDPNVLPDECVISAVTLAELSVGPHVADTARERSARQAHLQQSEARPDSGVGHRPRPAATPANLATSPG